ncbi:hypothetical protein [Vibrio owensii]|uniref:hypothetical protein n=1 Tax=Vibrio harveyi group TaxID=717610 RepID=UPI003CC5E577
MELIFNDSFGAPVINPSLEDIFDKVRHKVRRRVRQKSLTTNKKLTKGLYCEQISFDFSGKQILVHLDVNYLR